MISKNTIDQVWETARVEEVIGEYVSLKKAGAQLKGLSPFSDEKTGSFMVSPSKNIWKCFSSGKGGTAVSFLMEHQNMSYPDAIEKLADKYNIAIEFDEGFDKEAWLKEKATLVSNQKIMKAAARFYQKTLSSTDEKDPAHMEVYEHRKLTDDEVIQWQIGYCPRGSLLRSVLVDKGIAKQGEELFLVGEKFDKYQDRVIYPIHDAYGNVIGLAGRRLDDNSKYAKWLNGSNNSLYNKDNVLYGLHFASKHIKGIGKVYLVEGYNDVIAMHKYGCENTVAPCGTNVTTGQIKLLKRYTNDVVIVFDNDDKPDNPGMSAAMKTVNLFLMHGFSVELAILPVGDDPDSLTRSDKMPEILEGIGFANWMDDQCLDAVYKKADWLMSKATSTSLVGAAIDSISKMLACVQNDFMRELYLKDICKSYKIKPATLTRSVKEDIENAKNTLDRFRPGISKEQQNAWSKLPKGVDKDDVLKHGFYGISKQNDPRTGYWFRTSSEGEFKQVSNFVLTPLFHKYDQDDNTRIIKIENEFSTEIVEMPSKALITVDQFRTFLFDKGPFFFDGEKSHLARINKKYLYDFKKAYELKTLGWQTEGFFAFFNAAFNGSVKPYNEEGLIEHDEKFYFSPASSKIYNDFRKDDDMYENDRYLEYKPEVLSFAKWATLMHEVYEEHAFAAVPYVLVSLFRDVVFKVDNNSPFLYFYGQSKSGKSKCGESISNFFFKEMPAFNLNSGTDFAFAATLSRFRNCPAIFNEFDDSAVKPEWFQSLKGAYDGEGRQRGKGGSKKKTETQKINSSIILIGQYLSTKDDNSILSRSIMRSFKLNPNRKESQIKAYDTLKLYEAEGLNGALIKLLEQREFVEKHYYTLFNKKFKTLGKSIREGKHKLEERVLRNYSSLCTLYEMFYGRMEGLPWTPNEYDDWAKKEIISMSAMISSSDILTKFWDAIEAMVDTGELKHGVHFKVLHNVKQTKMTVNGKDIEVNLGNTKTVLWMRVKVVQILYAKFIRSVGGTIIDDQSLITYLKNREYFLGYIKSTRFDTKSTSAHLFDMKAIGVNLKDIRPEIQHKEIPSLGEQKEMIENGELPY